MFEAWYFLKKYDNIVIVETWLESKWENIIIKKLSNEYVWGTQAAVRDREKCRAKGELLIGVKNWCKKLFK